MGDFKPLTIWRIQEDGQFGSDRTPFQSLAEDWWSKPLPGKLEFALALSASSLYFAARSSFPLLSDAVDQDLSLSQRFRRELWRRDCFELFIADDFSKSYQEFNFAPSGSWWSALFSDYRVLQEECFDIPGLEVNAFSAELGSGWSCSVAVRIPLASLLVQCGFTKDARLSVCTIWGDGVRFSTTARYGCDEPDFHRLHELPQGLVSVQDLLTG